MVTIPKTRQTFCKSGKHKPHKLTQYKKGNKDSLYVQEKQCYCHQKTANYLSIYLSCFIMKGSKVAMEGRPSQFSGKKLKLQRK
jgi:ribosomal protein L44E